MDRVLVAERQRKIVEHLASLLRAPGAVAELVGPPSTGKSAIAMGMALGDGGVRTGQSETVRGWPGLVANELAPFIAERFSRSAGHHLLIVDQAETVPTVELHQLVRQLDTGPWTFSTLIVGRVHHGAGPVVLLDSKVGDFSELPFAQQLIGSDRVETIEKLSDLSPLLTDPRPVDKHRWQAAGLLDAQGRSLREGSAAERQIVSEVRHVDDELLRQVAQNRALLYELSPRKFEELVAELIGRQGYEVSLTPASHDGGLDMFVARKDGFGSFLYIVECKRHAPERPVSVGLIRALHGVLDQKRANGAVMVTTSYYTRSAQEFARTLNAQMQLKGFFDLGEWFSKYQRDGS